MSQATQTAQPLCPHLDEANPGRHFQMKSGRECWRCAFRNRGMLRRSIITSAVVGTILVAINQGTVIVAGDGTAELAWKIPLTYCVPFLVASWGALGNAYVRRV
ncbi:MAG: nitrate/nitrite transporter NrtS [Chloroflexota bacterium]|nr:nitrate/nitrite transporter NrtS [Chloroflexota bacterium]MDE2896667.1 nitrate/nitrite transporter NrtS [Chloroflexota bacterium]